MHRMKMIRTICLNALTKKTSRQEVFKEMMLVLAPVRFDSRR